MFWLIDNSTDCHNQLFKTVHSSWGKNSLENIFQFFKSLKQKFKYVSGWLAKSLQTNFSKREQDFYICGYNQSNQFHGNKSELFSEKMWI